MLWEVEVKNQASQIDREGQRVLSECRELAADSITAVTSARSFLIQAEADEAAITQIAGGLVSDPVVDTVRVRRLPDHSTTSTNGQTLLNVLFKPGVTDNVALSTQTALDELGLACTAVSTCRKYWFNSDATIDHLKLVESRVLANEAIETVLHGPLGIDTIAVGSDYVFELKTVALRNMTDDELEQLSRSGQLFLNVDEMRTIQEHFVQQDRDPTDVELETIAQTWSEHCSHKTLAGRIRYRDEHGEQLFQNMLKETIFDATLQIRRELGEADWCVSVFEDNAGIVTFDDDQHVCFKVETHNHPSALEPYGGANTGIGGVIRDPLGTGLGAKPIFNTNVFCFAPPETPVDQLPPGVLHPRVVAKGVVAGVRDYGNRMGIPTVNGAVFFDNRYLGNPLVYCGNVAMIPRDRCEKHMQPGDLVVAVGGRTGRDGIHGATFSSAELTQDSEMLSGGAVQIGNAITEKMVVDVILQARDEGLYSAITDCGAGGFSSAVGEMGEHTGAEVHLDRCPLKYSGLSYTEIWISEAQERMVLAVPPQHWQRFHAVCQAEGVEATAIGEFTDTGHLVLKFEGQTVGDLPMSFLHDGRPPIIREATFQAPAQRPLELPQRQRFDEDLQAILAELNVASKEWIIRQYDHEVQAGSVVKPLVGVHSDGPSDAAIVRPDLNSNRGLVVSNGMNPHYGDLDPYWMAAGAIDEAVRNCVAVGADPQRIAILDNFCWGNTDRPEILGSLVRAALACRDVAVRFQTPFISGKDSLYNEFSYVDGSGEKNNVTIPASLLISALGQIPDVNQAVTMDLKRPGNQLFLIGHTAEELGGSHFLLCNQLEGGQPPRVDLDRAPRYFAALHTAIRGELVRSCHDLSEGGLAVCLAEMCFAGEWGADIQLQALAQSCGLTHPAVLLFSESHTRFVCEVNPDKVPAFLQAFAELDCVPLGEVRDQPSLTVESPDGSICLDADWQQLKHIWRNALQWD